MLLEYALCTESPPGITLFCEAGSGWKMDRADQSFTFQNGLEFFTGGLARLGPVE